MDDELKRQVTAALDSMGLNFNTFVNMASIQLITKHRLPFDVEEPTLVPNEATLKVLVEEEAKSLGILPDDALNLTSSDAIRQHFSNLIEKP